jgi:hypothetical protein
MDQLEFVHSANIRRYQNLLETSVDEAERRTIQKLLSEEEAKQPRSNPPDLTSSARGRGSKHLYSQFSRVPQKAQKEDPDVQSNKI